MSRFKPIREAVLYWLFYAITGCIAILPRPLFYLQSDILAFVIACLFRYRRKVVHQNLANSFPELSQSQRNRIARRFYVHLSDLILESFFLLHASPKRIMKRCTYTNLKDLEAFYAEGRNVIVVAAHIANWEFLTTAAPLLKHHLLNVFKPVHNPRIGRFLTRSRERLGGTAVPMNRVLRAIVHYQQLNMPTVVGLVADQTPPPGNYPWLEFLNQDTMVYTGVEKLARQFNSAVFFCDMVRTRRGYYSVTLELITASPTDEPENSITQRYMQRLEAAIRRKPEAWLWSHKRWKRKRPTPVQS